MLLDCGRRHNQSGSYLTHAGGRRKGIAKQQRATQPHEYFVLPCGQSGRRLQPFGRWSGTATRIAKDEAGATYEDFIPVSQGPLGQQSGRVNKRPIA